jgi:hypothetical protein
MRFNLMNIPVLLVALSACGSDNGSSGSVPQPLAARPAPLAPPPPGTLLETTEYYYNGGLAAIKAVAAYQKGATGKGVVLGILDTGINPSNPELSGRLAPGSADFLDGGAVKDRDGHGTVVSSIIAGARNNRDGHGVAYEATLFAGRILNSYNSEVGRTQAEIQAANVAFYNAFANGVEAARLAGARSINLSIGFGPATVSDPNAPSPPRGPLDDAFDRTVKALDTAQRNGVIYVVSAGNESAARPNSFARLLLPENGAKVPVLIVGAVDQNNVIADFSNRAGTGTDARYFLVAPGVGIVARDIDGLEYINRGTSVAAPFVSGALGLLFQNAPNLTGQQAVDLLLSTATDLGAPGPDEVYGNGLLNIEKALQPQGAQSLALGASHVALPVDAPLASISGAFGSATGLRQALGKLSFLDGYDRAFTGDFSALVQNQSAGIGFASQATARQHFAASSLRAGTAAVQFSGVQADDWQRAPYELNRRDTRLRDVRLSLRAPLTQRLGLTAATGITSTELLGEEASTNMLLLDDARLSQANGARPDVSLGVMLDGRNWQWATAASYAAASSSLNVQARRWFGRSDIRFGLGLQSERGQLLGSQSRVLFGDAAGSRTLMAQLGWQQQFGAFSVKTRGQFGRAQIKAGANGLLDRDTAMLVSSFSALARYNISAAAHISLAVAQPLRVESGTAPLRIPTSYDYAARQSVFSAVQANLAPEARELDVELGYSGRIGPLEHVQINGFRRLNPGHRADLADDMGVLLRWQSRF